MVVNNSGGMLHPSWNFPVGDPGNYSDNPNHPFNRIVGAVNGLGRIYCSPRATAGRIVDLR